MSARPHPLVGLHIARACGSGRLYHVMLYVGGLGWDVGPGHRTKRAAELYMAAVERAFRKGWRLYDRMHVGQVILGQIKSTLTAEVT